MTLAYGGDRAPLGYASAVVPGWDGHTGTVPDQGPIEEPCDGCGHTRRTHPGPPERLSGCWGFHGWEARPTATNTVEASVVTAWACHACGHEQDVWGEGAVFSWMDCACGECGPNNDSGCGAQSYLVM